jgi:hypothetical protein
MSAQTLALVLHTAGAVLFLAGFVVLWIAR